MQKLHPRAYPARNMYAINVDRIVVINLKNGQYKQIRTNDFTRHSHHHDPVSAHSRALKFHLPPPDPQHITDQIPPPSPRKQGLRYPDAQQWEKAYNAELEKLDNVNAIKRIADKDLSPGAKLIPLAMGYKYKRTAEGDITERKARCSLRGDLMRPHQHYNPDHTAPPTADKTTIRVLLAVKAAYGLTAAHFDINRHSHMRYTSMT